MIKIPDTKPREISHVVCDYNGTIAKDGIVLPCIKTLFEKLAKEVQLYVITADTFGSVQAQLKNHPCKIKILTSEDHTQEKADFITQLGSQYTIALGNGNNDQRMLQTAEIGIAILGNEGCAKETLLSADILSNNIQDALELLLFPKRLLATIRR